MAGAPTGATRNDRHRRSSSGQPREPRQGESPSARRHGRDHHDHDDHQDQEVGRRKDFVNHSGLPAWSFAISATISCASCAKSKVGSVTAAGAVG